MNNIRQKKNDILQTFARLARYPVIQSVIEHKRENGFQCTCLHCGSSSASNGISSLSHIVFQQQDNKNNTCNFCNHTTKDHNTVLTSSHNSIYSKHNHADKLINSAKQHWTRNKIKMVQAIAATFTILVLTFCLLFQPGASPQEQNNPSWTRGDFDTAKTIDNRVSKFSLPPSLASRFGIHVGNDNILSPIDDITQNDLFISVKTSQKFHEKRLSLVLKTWFQLARDQTWFFTDQHDPEIEEQTSKFVCMC